MKRPQRCLLAATALLAVAARSLGDVLNLPSGQTSLQIVTVGNEGNAPDPATGLGAVSYAYNIGEFDVTAAQYVAFLNAVAANDPYGLYSTAMAGNADCGIQRSGSPGNYGYSVDAVHANHPVNFITFGNAARFCNWLTNGQPTGKEDLTTTEDGSYYLNGATSNAQLLAVSRKANARFVLPTENEWYKAAYHKNDGVTGDYWAYPTQSNAAPIAEAPPGHSEPPGSANFLSVMGSNHLTDVGAYSNSPGPYGTFDQGGLLFQWTDTLLNAGYSGFAQCNSSWESSSSNELRSNNQIWPWSPTDSYNFTGFRVALESVTSQWQSNTGGNWGTAGNWNNWVPQFALDTAIFGAVAGGNAVVNVTLETSRTVGHLVFNSNHGQNYTITRAVGDTSSSLIFDNGSDPATISASGGGSHTIAVPVVLHSNLVVDVEAGTILTIAGAISDGAGGDDVTEVSQGGISVGSPTDVLDTAGPTSGLGIADDLLNSSARATAFPAPTSVYCSPQQSAVSEVTQAVPEPTSLGLLILGALTLYRTKRSRQNQANWIRKGASCS